MAMAANGIVKLLEEMGELQQVLAKKLAYFDVDEHPDGKGSLQERIEDEMGDVLAAIIYTMWALNLNDKRINARESEKSKIYAQWAREN